MPKTSYNNIPKLIRDLPAIMDLATETAGVYYAGKVGERIDAQDPTWAPKAEGTIQGYIARRQRAADKRARELGRRRRRVPQIKKEKLWINLGDLRSEIRQQSRLDAERRGEQYTVRVGVFSEDRAIAALVLEHGSESQNVPARPAFGPVFDEQRAKMEQLYADTISKQISRYLF